MRYAIIAAAAASLAPPTLARADVPPEQAPEVEHLLQFIRSTSCELVRNGRRYGGDRAHRHVMRKYDHFRDEIASTEDFIAYVATKSERSGRPYLFSCNGVETESAEMLLDELERFRARGAAADADSA
jgi:hypothetical protein